MWCFGYSWPWSVRRIQELECELIHHLPKFNCPLIQTWPLDQENRQACRAGYPGDPLQMFCHMNPHLSFDLVCSTHHTHFHLWSLTWLCWTQCRHQWKWLLSHLWCHSLCTAWQSSCYSFHCLCLMDLQKQQTSGTFSLPQMPYSIGEGGWHRWGKLGRSLEGEETK